MEGRKEALFVLFDPKKLVSGWLSFWLFCKRERVGTKNTQISRRKKELFIERTKRNVTTTRKRRKRKKKRRRKRSRFL